jgi:predicted O-linked N-acetylglucosamine transferase (SPINDLY family)
VYLSTNYRSAAAQPVVVPAAPAVTPLQAAVAHHRAGRPAEAEQAYRAILAQRPDHAEALDYLGVLLHQQGRNEEALRLIQAAVDRMPRHAGFRSDLGTVHQQMGDLDAAVACFRQALAVEPGFADGHYNLGNALSLQGKRDDALVSYRRALALSPRHVRAHFNLANLCHAMGRGTEALESMRRAVAIDPRLPGAWGVIGAIAWSRGRLEEAADAYRRALEIDPLQPKVHSDLIYLLTYNGLASEAEILAEARRWESRHALPLAGLLPPPPNLPDPGRRLRIGYVSPDFRSHCVAHFIEPLLARHDRDAFEIFCYAEVKKPDAATARLQKLAHHWRDTVGRSDREVAAAVRADGIDILVDLAGHTADSRLQIFGARPAPVQVTWIGFLGTTGLGSIDYIFGNKSMIPEAHRADFSEQVWDLEAYCAFEHPVASPPPRPAPVLSRGHVTFGCFNNAAKIREPALAAWARIMAAVPDARLVLKSAPLGDPDVAAEFGRRLAGLGVDPARVEFRGASMFEEYLRSYGDIDVALDPFPANGGTTTRDTLLMGVPLVTLWGNTFASRTGGATLAALGLEELAAATVDRYVETAVDLARDPERLARLRPEIRRRVDQSIISDPAALTREVEAAFRAMWRRWCDAQPAPAAAAG